MKRDNFESAQVVNIFLLFSGFMFITYFPLILHIPPQFLTIPYRFICALLSLLLVCKCSYRYTNVQKIVVFFWLLYGIRMFYDLHIADLSISFQYKSDYIYWSYFLGVGLLPMLAFSSISDKNLRYFYFIYLYSLALSLFISLFMGISLTTLESGAEGRTGANQTIQVLLYGHMGVSLVLLSICDRFNLNKLARGLFILLGIIVLLKSGSRGPAFSLIFCLLIYYSSRIKVKEYPKYILFVLVFLLIFSLCSSFLFNFLSSKFETFFIRMSLLSASDTALNGRELLYAQALKDFYENPFLGNHFVLTEGFGEGYYPHNSLLESFMALGFVGGVIYVIILGITIKKAITMLKIPNVSWISLLFFQNLLYSMSSMALYKHQSMWIFLFIILSFNIKKYYDKDFCNNRHLQ